MCGILVNSSLDAELKEFENALDGMKHRGPDARGIVKEGGWRLGHTRLKILDLDDRSNQPFMSRDGRYLMVYNGEVYNYRELSAKYDLDCHTSGDTEVLMLLYQKLGVQMLNELNGMFAIVILDRLSGDVFFARDRLGIKPLYYKRSTDGLIVASEISPILSFLDNVEYDYVGLRQYAKLRAFFNGRTAYKGIKMLPAGHYRLNDRLVKYWNLPLGEQQAPSDEELRDLIEKAVRRRCISDVEVGSYLSGGLDSTIVAGLADKPHTWTVGFDGYNEFEWARIAAERFGSQHHEVGIEREEFLSMARKMIGERREPLSVPNEVLLLRMTQEVKKHNTVVLSGEGADELFFGYDRIFRWAAEQKEWDLRAFSAQYSYGLHEDLEVLEDVMAPFVAEGQTPLDIVARFFQIGHLHGLLRRVDNSTMRCSVEARVPFVDHTLVERMAGVSAEFRMKDGEVKAPLKRIFSDVLPDEIIHRRKIGFPVPLEEIFFGRSSDQNGPQRDALDHWLKFNLKCLTGGEMDLADLGI
ncbi:asparagine synthase (glutamine-hydrolyzing) [Rubritalea tangerina]|uniref:asparagine synthase (glutamine-hydrolyzing) n=1 Tax=Rubritalea tangerina TaxID=430798 RepID=A0ABW4ZAS3_9BACT